MKRSFKDFAVFGGRPEFATPLVVGRPNDHLPEAVRDRSLPLAERVAALAGRRPAGNRSTSSNTPPRAPSMTQSIRPAVAAIAGGHAAGIDRSTVFRSPVSGAASETIRLVRSARSEHVVPAPLPAPRMPMLSPSGAASYQPTDGPMASVSPESSAGRSEHVSRQSSPVVRRREALVASPSSSVASARSDAGRDASVDRSHSRDSRRIVRSHTAVQRRAARVPVQPTRTVSRAIESVEPCGGGGESPQDDRLESTDLLLEALEERILRALERRGGVQRGWF